MMFARADQHGMKPAAEIAAVAHVAIVHEDGRAIGADVQAQLASQGAVAIGKGPDEFADYLKADTDKWSRVIKAASTKIK